MKWRKSGVVFKVFSDVKKSAETSKAADETRTHNIYLGKVALYH